MIFKELGLINAAKYSMIGNTFDGQYQNLRLFKGKDLLLEGNFTFLFDPFRIFLNTGSPKNISLSNFIIFKDLKIMAVSNDFKITGFTYEINGLSNLQHWQIKRFLE